MKWFVLAAAFAVSATHAQTAWKLATGYRVESFHTQNIVQFAREVEQSTAGKLRIEVHANNSLFKLPDIPNAVQAGDLAAGETIMTNMVADLPLAGADAIPFVVGTYADARRLWDLQRPLIEKHFAKRDLLPLYAVPWPPQGLFTKTPIQSLADFKGKRMRTYNLSTQRISQMLGADPVDVPMVEVNQALAAGRMDSMITSAVTGVENQVWSQLGHYYTINAWFPKNIVFVNLKAFQSLSPNVREALLATARQAEARGWAMSQQVADSSTQALAEKGMKVGRVPPNVEAELKRLGERFSREWVQSVGNEANTLFVPYYFQR